MTTTKTHKSLYPRIQFHWIDSEGRWEVREMFGLYAYRVRGFISLDRWSDGTPCLRCHLDQVYLDYFQVTEALEVFDLVEAYLESWNGT
jgi:hypothetical protein